MKSKTVLFGFAALFVLLAFTVAPVAAVKPADNLNGKAQVVKLVEKDSADWSIVDGAFGSIMYQQSKFVFNGHGLTQGEYTLISYVEPTDVSPFGDTVQIILGSGEATEQGNLLIKGGEINLACNSYAADAEGDYQGVSGSKIWLVPSTALNSEYKFQEWNPDNYLFETSLIPCVAA